MRETHEGICREPSLPSCSICYTEDQPWASLWSPESKYIYIYILAIQFNQIEATPWLKSIFYLVT